METHRIRLLLHPYSSNLKIKCYLLELLSGSSWNCQSWRTDVPTNLLITAGIIQSAIHIRYVVSERTSTRTIHSMAYSSPCLRARPARLDDNLQLEVAYSLNATITVYRI